MIHLQEVKGVCSVKTVCITPEVAAQILQEYKYDRQRSIRQWKVNEFAAYMKGGAWLQEAEPIILARMGSESILIDGYHRLWAVFESGLNQVFLVLEYPVANVEELNNLYMNVDRGTRRNDVDLIRAAGLDKESGLSLPSLEKAHSAVKFINAGFRSQSIAGRSVNPSPQEMVKAIEEWLPSMIAFRDTAGSRSECYRLYTQPVLSVALATMRYQQERAADFWRRIGRNTDLTEGTPEHTLSRYMFFDDRGMRIEAQGRAVYARKVAHAWNAFFEGKKLIKLISRDPATDIEIAGTPWKRKSGWEATRAKEEKAKQEKE